MVETESKRDARYLTDGVHLYEVESVVQNYGKTNGLIMTVRDCVSEAIRELSQTEQALCRWLSC